MVLPGHEIPAGTLVFDSCDFHCSQRIRGSTSFRVDLIRQCTREELTRGVADFFNRKYRRGFSSSAETECRDSAARHLSPASPSSSARQNSSTGNHRFRLGRCSPAKGVGRVR